ncbi:MAG: hypothetical protein IPN33_10440 [Saprospiraceae bacterium]|nr:hypothetical protein [Saprospiraceae bacterium]
MRTFLLAIICWSVAANVIIDQSAGRSESGNAIYYADHLEGQPTSLGEIYYKNELTCSHRSYAKGTLLRVTRYDNNKSVVVRVNDNELHCGDCVVMLSKAGAAEIDLLKVGKTKVWVESVGNSNVNPQSAYRNQAQNTYSNDLTAKGGNTTNRSYSPNGTQQTAKGGAPAIAAGSPQRLPAGLDGYVINWPPTRTSRTPNGKWPITSRKVSSTCTLRKILIKMAFCCTKFVAWPLPRFFFCPKSPQRPQIEASY